MAEGVQTIRFHSLINFLIKFFEFRMLPLTKHIPLQKNE